MSCYVSRLGRSGGEWRVLNMGPALWGVGGQQVLPTVVSAEDTPPHTQHLIRTIRNTDLSMTGDDLGVF